MAVRLSVIHARKAPVAVVLRRGPSKKVLLCVWRTDRDEVIEGQWLKGRVYERRCDLSPSGKRLIYFAANYKEPYFSWTAVSRPPFFTALALWPKGDAWGGGGLFSSEHVIHLNHRDNERRLAPAFKLPLRIRVRRLGSRPGWGEDSPIWEERIRRDGWMSRHPGQEIQHPYGSATWFEYSPPIQWSKPEPGSRPRYELWMSINGLKERDGPWYVTNYEVRGERDEVIDLGRCDSVEWSPEGDVLLAKNGMLFRLRRLHNRELPPVESAVCVADLTSRTFAPREAPPAAKTWSGNLPV